MRTSKTTRERQGTGIRWHSSVNPRARVARVTPSPVAWILERKAAQARRLAAVRSAARVAAALALLSLVFVHIQPALGLQIPSPPPGERICGSQILDGGPTTPPPGAVSVPAGDNSGVTFTTPGATYWFAPGTHTIGTGQFSQIIPGNNSTFTGAPGAILDGQGLNQFAFGGSGNHVTIEYLTIQDFIPPGAQGAVNVDGQPDWTVKYTTLQDNLPGAGMMLGSDSDVEFNCMTENGEYGFNGYSVNSVSPLTGGPQNVTVSGNEISFNNTCDWEVSPGFPITPPAGCTGAGQFVGCGCSGGGKFWENDQATVMDNYVHDNYSVGLWADTNDNGFNFSGNYISDNFSNGILYEISYNASITGNIFVRNAIPGGKNNPGFPNSAIYISESGSDSRVAGSYGTGFAITGNQFYDNWGGVILWENADRYCTSVANTSTGSCTLVNPAEANIHTCNASTATPLPPSRPVKGPAPPGRRTLPRGGLSQGQASVVLVSQQPWKNDCRWRTQNITVSGNLFDYTPASVDPACTAGNACGFNGVFSQFGSIYPFFGTGVEQNVTFHQANLFSSNTYCGPWNFMPLEQGTTDTFAQWQAAPYNQDPGSTLDVPASCTSPAPPPVIIRVPGAPPNRPVVVPIRIGRR